MRTAAELGHERERDPAGGRGDACAPVAVRRQPRHRPRRRRATRQAPASTRRGARSNEAASSEAVAITAPTTKTIWTIVQKLHGVRLRGAARAQPRGRPRSRRAPAARARASSMQRLARDRTRRAVCELDPAGDGDDLTAHEPDRRRQPTLRMAQERGEQRRPATASDAGSSRLRRSTWRARGSAPQRQSRTTGHRGTVRRTARGCTRRR